MVSIFNDIDAAREEAQFLAETERQRYYLIQTKKGILVSPRAKGRKYMMVALPRQHLLRVAECPKTEKIVRMHREGQSHNVIAMAVGMSKQGVAYRLKVAGEIGWLQTNKPAELV